MSNELFEWPCATCTYVNSIFDSECEMCSTVRPLLGGSGGSAQEAPDEIQRQFVEDLDMFLEEVKAPCLC